MEEETNTQPYCYRHYLKNLGKQQAHPSPDLFCSKPEC